jgi:predicted dehydrogenase
MIKIGIIGFGRMGITHYSIINTHPEVNIVAVADTSKVTLGILKKYIDSVDVYGDYKELIDKSKPDAVIVSTPPSLHYPIIRYAFERGINVFCEKPFTANIREAEELARLFSSAQLINQVGYANRFRDVFQETKVHLLDGVIGKVSTYRSEMLSGTVTKKSTGSNWRDQAEHGGGVIFEMASHLIDLNNFLFGKPVGATGAILERMYSINVDDIVKANIFHESGLHGSIYVNWCDTSYRKPHISVEAVGSKGKIIADFYGYKIFLNEKNDVLKLKKGWNVFTLPEVNGSVEFYLRGNEFTRQLYYFVDCILNGIYSNESSFEAALFTHSIIEKITLNQRSS